MAEAKDESGPSATPSAGTPDAAVAPVPAAPAPAAPTPRPTAPRQRSRRLQSLPTPGPAPTFRSLLDISLPAGMPPESLLEQRAWAELRKLQLETERTMLELDTLRRAERDRAADPRAANVYTFYSAVEPESVQQCMAELGTWSRREPGCAITVIFNSPGGSVLDGLALFDYLHQLRAVGHEVTTMALGRAASMGAVLLQAGSRRVIGQNAFLLIHEVSNLSSGRVSELEDSVDFTKRLQKRLLAILAERSTLAERDIQRRWARKEWWVDAVEAVELGLADELL